MEELYLEEMGEGEEPDEAYEQYQKREEIRCLELIQFIDDLLENLEEVYLSQDPHINRKEDKTIQVEANILKNQYIPSINKKSANGVEPPLAEEKNGKLIICKVESDHGQKPKSIYSLTKQGQKLWSLREKLEYKLQNQASEYMRQCQEQSIKVVREKIAEAKRTYSCHFKERRLLTNQYEEKVLSDLKDLKDLTSISIKAKNKLFQKVVAYKKLKYLEQFKRRGRQISIIKKLIGEFKRQKQINYLENKTYDYKVTPRKNAQTSQQDIDILLEALYNVCEEENIESEELVDVPVMEAPQEAILKDKSASKKESKETKGKKEKKPKNEKMDKGAKEKTPKGVKEEVLGKNEQVEVLPDLVLPNIPITNIREKIKPDSIEKMENVLERLIIKDMINFEQQQFSKYKQSLTKVLYPKDPLFYWHPDILEFQGYIDGVSYTRRIRIYNGNTIEKRCRFDYVSVPEEFNANIIKVEALGAQSVIQGMSFDIDIMFVPTDNINRVIKGEIMFVTYSLEKEENHHFGVPFTCIPFSSCITVSTCNVKFNTIPIWKAKELSNYKNFRTLKVCNTGKKTCKICIAKMRNPLEDDEEEETEECDDEDCKEVPKSEENLPEFQVSENETDKIIQEILYSTIEDIFNPFMFDCCFFELQAESKKKLKVFFKNVDYIGSYNEKYLLKIFEDVRENELECVGSQELMVTAETSGHFIEVTPEVLDFNVCAFDSVYQLSLTLTNKANIPHGVVIRFPTSLKYYFSCRENNIYIPAHERQKIFIRFIPRKKITEKDSLWNSYYNEQTHILEFPIRVCITSTALIAPPIKIPTFAILTNPNGLTIIPEQTEFSFFYHDKCDAHLNTCECLDSASYLIDLGECTIAESVFTEIELANTSYVHQDFGCLNLPKSLQITPNNGFGEIEPISCKNLTLTFTPVIAEIFKYDIEGDSANNEVMYKLSFVTVKSLGGLKPVKKSITCESMEDVQPLILKVPTFEFSEKDLSSIDLEYDTSSKSSEQSMENSSVNGRQAVPLSTQNIFDENNSSSKELHMKYSLNNKLWVKAKIIVPACDLSHQYIEFPDTPCGSYSLMNITLRAISNFEDKCLCGYTKKFSEFDADSHFTAHFEILGDNPEICIEPTCGHIQRGETIKITLVARPEMSENTILETAKDLKVAELLLKKREQWEIKRQKELAQKLAKEAANSGKDGKKGKDKGAKKEKGKKDTKPNIVEGRESDIIPVIIPEFSVDESEIVLNYLDMYPAEMFAWKYLEPYSIKGHFCCTITYPSTDIFKKPEKLYFEALCKVVKPDFTHNLTTQRINFGPVAVGSTVRKILTIQNISGKEISPMITLLSPTGYFSCPSPRGISVPPDHLLNIPITFTPSENEEVIEYFEIKSGLTTCCLVTTGQGVESNIVINPDFVVCRLEANPGGFSDCSLEISNKCVAPIAIQFVKLCELVGEIIPIEKPTEAPSSAKEEKNKKGKPDKSSKGKQEKPKKIVKFSKELFEDEEASLKERFVPKEGESYFEILGANNSILDVNPNSKKVIKIRFGVPLSPEEKLAASAKGKKGKGKSDAKSSSKKSKQSNESQKYYVAKFNILLGTSLFLRDVIIIATFK